MCLFLPRRCTICMCEYVAGDELRHTRCAHAFHRMCLDKWLEKSIACPLCTQSVRKARNLHKSDDDESKSEKCAKQCKAHVALNMPAGALAAAAHAALSSRRCANTDAPAPLTRAPAALVAHSSAAASASGSTSVSTSTHAQISIDLA